MCVYIYVCVRVHVVCVVCVYVHLCMCIVCVWVHVCASKCSSYRSILGVFLRSSTLCFLRQDLSLSSSLSLELTSQAKQDSQQASQWSSFLPAPSNAAYRRILPCLGFGGCLGSDLKSSCLCIKHFTLGAISPVTCLDFVCAGLAHSIARAQMFL